MIPPSSPLNPSGYVCLCVFILNSNLVISEMFGLFYIAGSLQLFFNTCHSDCWKIPKIKLFFFIYLFIYFFMMEGIEWIEVLTACGKRLLCRLLVQNDTEMLTFVTFHVLKIHRHCLSRASKTKAQSLQIQIIRQEAAVLIPLLSTGVARINKQSSL